jgi:hypothetical protein
MLNMKLHWNPLKMLTAAMLPTQPPPKAPKGGGLAFPGYRKTIVAAPTVQIAKPAFDVANVDLATTYRNGATTLDTVRNLSRVSPELAASLAANTRVGIPEKYIAIARDPDGAFNVEATALVLQLLRQMNTMPDYVNGFSHVASLRSVSEALSKEIQQTGACAMELVLDKARMPSQFMPVPVSSLVFFDDDKGVRPMQKVGADFIDLDVPTFFYVALDPSLLDVYAQSPLESAIQPVIASTGFLNDMRALCSRHVYQRYDISIDEDKLRARIPPEVLNDTDKLNAYLNTTIADVETAINTLGVSEALVHFDFFEIKYIEDSGNTPQTFEAVKGIYDGKIATATKTPPSVLGFGAGSSTAASAETLMFMMNANGMIRLKLQEMYSKGLTLAVRLFGLDVTVSFEFDDIELRPASETEAYRAMKFERITNQLSYGFISDEEACLRLTGNLPPAGYVAKTGTMFKQGTSQPADANADPNATSPTSNMNKATGQKSPEQPKGVKK